MQEFPMTEFGYQALKNELETLVKVEREQVKKDIAEARAHGDLKENAEYHAAKEKQSMIEGRISELQAKIANAKVVKISQVKGDKIVFGATVTLYHLEKEQSVTYQIVGEDEAQTSDKKISYSSPLGKAMIGKEEGDEVIVKAPKGDVYYEIESFEYK